MSLRTRITRLEQYRRGFLARIERLDRDGRLSEVGPTITAAELAIFLEAGRESLFKRVLEFIPEERLHLILKECEE